MGLIVFSNVWFSELPFPSRKKQQKKDQNIVVAVRNLECIIHEVQKHYTCPIFSPLN